VETKEFDSEEEKMIEQKEEMTLLTFKLEWSAEFIGWFCGAESQRYRWKASSNSRASLFRRWRKRFTACRLISAFGKDRSLTKHNRGG